MFIALDFIQPFENESLSLSLAVTLSIYLIKPEIIYKRSIFYIEKINPLGIKIGLKCGKHKLHTEMLPHIAGSWVRCC